MTDEGRDHDQRLNAILLDYVDSVERGEHPDTKAILAAHPDLADDLSVFFGGRRMIERLTTDFRAPARVGTASATLDEPGLGRIGDFRLIREVGSGGMGVVYEAEQVSLRRRVALKILPFASTFDPRQLQRFRNEALAAAQLHHTAIVPVYAVGMESGVHYYAMQYIDGQSLSELIEGLRRAGPAGVSEQSGTRDVSSTGWVPPRPGPDSSDTLAYPLPIVPEGRRGPRAPSAVASAVLSTFSAERGARFRRYFERVAGLGIQAAEGLEHAHELGVIHRDIKPANLLLDARGDLWITDFGLALLRSDPGPTMTGELVGTARFMSPEQASGSRGLVDHRTDVYSLGITLYELLTLTPAFECPDRHELLRQIAAEEPRPPRAIDPSIPIELETIVLKAIAKDPAERYDTAGELAEDLRRFAQDRPILARRPTLPEVAARWVRRHRALALASVASMAAALVGLSVFAAILAREHSLTKLALEGQREKTREAGEQRAVAEANFLSARKAVDFFAELSREELLEFPPMMDVRRRLLEASVAYYRELQQRRPDDPALRRELASSRARLDRLVEDIAAMSVLDACLLLSNPSAQAELGLSAEQLGELRTDVLSLPERLFRSRPELPGRPARWKGLADLARTARQALARTLTPSQARRLDQIALQHPGPHSFTQPETIRRLGLSEAQQERIRDIQVEAGREILNLMGPAEEPREAWMRQVEVWRRANREILGLFTPSQQATWDEMIGPPFQVATPFPLTPRREAPPVPGR
ncbi:serine/threonine-protein kinase [Aquisphaera insulae]|uniref:serine/threonine-protein kinase n=1 Tax=Aquisphaera insulae TaxID=2712864 RepID=UPI0013EC4460|nr:serine/threonine-protein kinase [Aquisphaera insulae]